MPRINPHQPPGELYVALNEQPDAYNVCVLRLTQNLLDVDVSARLARIAGAPGVYDVSHRPPIDTNYQFSTEEIGCDVSISPPFSDSGRLSPTYQVSRLGVDHYKITQPEIKLGDLLWCATYQGDSLELRHILPERLSAAAVARVIERQRHQEAVLRTYDRQAEQDYFASLPELDVTTEFELFDRVQVCDTGASFRYEVPPRKIVSEKYGLLELRVHGRHNWFKREADFGSLRVVSHRRPDAPEWFSGHWFPHAYVSEDVDQASGLPTIADQERADVTVSIGNPYRTLPEDIEHQCQLTLSARSGDYELLFDEYSLIGQQGHATQIEYGYAASRSDQQPQRRMYTEDMRELYPELVASEDDMSDDEPPLPQLQRVPRRMWVPVAQLVAGTIEAKIKIDGLF